MSSWQKKIQEREKKHLIGRLRNITWSAALTVALLSFALYRRVPEVFKNYNLESQKFPSASLQNLNLTRTVFPYDDHTPFVALFWATWCGPCKLEMDRIQKAIHDNKLPAGRVFAIHIEGTTTEVMEHMTKFGYTFPALVDSDGLLARTLDVNSTPSIFFVNPRGEIEWASSGIGVSDVWRMENFLAGLSSAQ